MIIARDPREGKVVAASEMDTDMAATLSAKLHSESVEGRQIRKSLWPGQSSTLMAIDWKVCGLK